MFSERELKKRLVSIKTTGKLAAALKTVATAKFSQMTAKNTEYKEYSEKCRELLSCYGDGGYSKALGDGNVLYVLIAGQKGFCGGYNNTLFSFFSEKMGDGDFCIACGKKAIEFCKNKNIPYTSFVISDTPQGKDADALFELVQAQMTDYGKVCVVYNKYVNVLTQLPTEEILLPFVSEHGPKDVLMLPSEAEIVSPLAKMCLVGRLYGIMLESALGLQAATMMTMRSAADNAEDTARSVETALNRERQRKLTAAVIESASGNK